MATITKYACMNYKTCGKVFFAIFNPMECPHCGSRLIATDQRESTLSLDSEAVENMFTEIDKFLGGHDAEQAEDHS